MSKIYVGGTFDLFHPGHIRLLKRAAQIGQVWVSLNTDEFATEYKRKPVMSYAERAEILEACRYVTNVVENTGGADSRPAIEKVAPKYIVHGDDWMGDSYLAQLGVTREWLHELDIALVYFPYTDWISTSEIEDRIRVRQPWDRSFNYTLTPTTGTNRAAW